MHASYGSNEVARALGQFRKFACFLDYADTICTVRVEEQQKELCPQSARKKHPDIVPAGRKMSVPGGAEMARTDRSNRNKLQAKTAIHFLLPSLFLSRCLARTNAPRMVGLSLELEIDYPKTRQV